MNYIIMIALLLSVLRIFDLQRRISQLETHNPANRNKSYSSSSSSATGTYESHVYVIPDMSKKRF